MRETLFTIGLVLATAAGFVVQEFIPPLWIADGARVILAPVFFCYGACTLPFVSMLVLALAAGFLSDFTTLQIVDGAATSTDLNAMPAPLVEIPAGWSILLFVALGLICQGLRPLVLRGQWWLPALMSAGTTAIYLGLQFTMITARRFELDGLFWSDAVAWRIVAPAMIAFLLTMILVMVVMIIDGTLRGRRPLRDF